MNSTQSWILASLAVFFLSMPPCAASAWTSDELEHVGTSFILGSVSYLMLKKSNMNKFERLLTSVVITTTVGIAKELADKQFSETDLQADAVGIGASTLFMFTFDW